jgi:hypothetical protein
MSGWIATSTFRGASITAPGAHGCMRSPYCSPLQTIGPGARDGRPAPTIRAFALIDVRVSAAHDHPDGLFAAFTSSYFTGIEMCRRTVTWGTASRSAISFVVSPGSPREPAAVGIHVLQQVHGGTSAQGLKQVLVGVGDREQDHV